MSIALLPEISPVVMYKFIKYPVASVYTVYIYTTDFMLA